MRRIIAVVFSFLLLTQMLPLADAQQYRFIPHYEPAEAADLQDIANSAIQDRPFDLLADALTDVFELPRDVHIVMAECGVSNAFYNPQQSAIVMCYELARDILYVFDAASSQIENADELAGGAFVFVFIHELGHALIDLYDLDVLAGEEDAADRFATLILIYAGLPEYVFGAAVWWGLTATEPTQEVFADEHLLNQQRFYNMLCLLYGSDPETNQYLVTEGMLPAARAERCPSEYSQASKSWDSQLASHIREQVREPVEIMFDKDTYTFLHDREAVITVVAASANTMLNAKDAIDVFVYSTSDPIGIAVKVPETGINTGIFSKSVRLNTIKLSKGDTITAEYIPTYSYGAVYSTSATIIFGETKPPSPPQEMRLGVYEGEWIKYKFSEPKFEAIDPETQKAAEDAFLQSFVTTFTEEDVSFEDIEWMKVTVNKVKGTEVTSTATVRLADGTETPSPAQTFDVSTTCSNVIPINVKAGDTLACAKDAFGSAVVKGVTKKQIAGKSMEVFEITATSTETLDETSGLVSELSTRAIYDKNTGMMLEFTYSGVLTQQDLTLVEFEIGIYAIEFSAGTSLREAEVKVTIKQVKDLLLIRVKGYGINTITFSGAGADSAFPSFISACKAKGWQATTCTEYTAKFESKTLLDGKAMFLVKIHMDINTVDWSANAGAGTKLFEGTAKVLRL